MTMTTQAQRQAKHAAKPAPQAARAKSVTKARREETKAADANAAKLAKAKAATPPKAAEPKAKGSAPTAIGVAQGAMDGQPHTAQAVREARKAEKAAFDAIKDAKVAEGYAYYLDPARNVQKWIKNGDRLPIGALKLYPAPKATKDADGPRKSSATPKAKASEPKTPRAPRAQGDRKYAKGATKNEAKPGTWRHHMLTIIQANTSTEAAKAAHAKSGAFSDQNLDFNWSAKQGYITFA
jgi:hypothetical protein